MTSIPVELQSRLPDTNHEFSSSLSIQSPHPSTDLHCEIQSVASTPRATSAPGEPSSPNNTSAPSPDTAARREDTTQKMEEVENGLPLTIDEHPGHGQVEFTNVTVSDHNDTADSTFESDAVQLRVTCVQEGKMEEAAAIKDDEDPLGARKNVTLDKLSSNPITRRKSHLRLDIRPPPSQPWELINPPTHISPTTSQKKRSFQPSTFATQSGRPLIPKSSYYFGPPPSDSAFGTPPVGQIGVHHPREIIRIERDYTGGELTQFAPIYPLELEGRITPTHFLESINAINELLISAHSIRYSLWDNVLTIFTLQLSRLFWTTHYEKEMTRLMHLFEELNTALYNPVGLNLLWPRDVAFLFLEIEYY